MADGDYADPFAPDRSQNRTVRCLHCGQSYPEHEAVYEHRPKFSVNLPPGEKLWWCRNPGCDGAGIGFDLQPPPSPEQIAAYEGLRLRSAQREARQAKKRGGVH